MRLNNCAKKKLTGLCDTSFTAAVTRQNIDSFAGCCPSCWLVGDRKKAAAVLSKMTLRTAGCVSQLVLTCAPARKADVPVILAYEEVTSRPHACWLLCAFTWEHAWLMIQSSSLSLAMLRLSMQDALRAICLMASTFCYLVL